MLISFRQNLTASYPAGCPIATTIAGAIGRTAPVPASPVSVPAGYGKNNQHLPALSLEYLEVAISDLRSTEWRNWLRIPSGVGFNAI